MIDDSDSGLASWIIHLEESALHSFLLHEQQAKVIILLQSKLLDMATGETNYELLSCLKTLSIRNIYVTMLL